MQTIWAFLKSISSNLKLLCLVFGQFLETVGVLFISKSGHTGHDSSADCIINFFDVNDCGTAVGR